MRDSLEERRGRIQPQSCNGLIASGTAEKSVLICSRLFSSAMTTTSHSANFFFRNDEDSAVRVATPQFFPTSLQLDFSALLSGATGDVSGSCVFCVYVGLILVQERFFGVFYHWTQENAKV